jgi:hypothetical protein
MSYTKDLKEFFVRIQRVKNEQKYETLQPLFPTLFSLSPFPSLPSTSINLIWNQNFYRFSARSSIRQCEIQKDEYEHAKALNIKAEEEKLEAQKLEAGLKLEYIEVSIEGLKVKDWGTTPHSTHPRRWCQCTASPRMDGSVHVVDLALLVFNFYISILLSLWQAKMGLERENAAYKEATELLHQVCAFTHQVMYSPYHSITETVLSLDLHDQLRMDFIRFFME